MAAAPTGTAMASKRSRGFSPLASRRTLIPETKAMATKGTFTMNTARQPTQSTRRAPSVGARAADRPAMPPHTPRASDRRSTGNSGSRRARDAG
jgi:hypothetical protein